MTSTSESGHAKNVANFEDLIAFCTGYGATYNPSKASIKLAALSTLYTTANTSLASIKTAKTAFDNATNAREIAFKDLPKLCTRLISALSATDASKQVLDDAKSINKKIQGSRTKTIKKDETQTEQPKTISVSQQSYDSKTENFAKLIEILTAEPTYKPNEAELKTTALTTLLTKLKTANTTISTEYTKYSNAMIARNAVLYDPEKGLAPIALDVKNYVKSIYGATSPQYRQISAISFKKPAK